MSWGWMVGLGSGLQQVGGMMLDHNKTKMREQLEMEREQRQVQRELDKENRQLARFSGNYDIDRDNGLKYKINNAGERMPDPVPLTAYEIEQQSLAERLARAEVAGKEQNVEKGSIDILLGGKKLEAFDVDKALERRQTEASITSSLASAEASRARAMNAGGTDGGATTPEESDIITDLMKDLGSYGDKVDRFAIEEAAREALEHARNQARNHGIRIDPLSYARTILRNRYGSSRDVPKGQEPRGVNWR